MHDGNNGIGACVERFGSELPYHDDEAPSTSNLYSPGEKQSFMVPETDGSFFVGVTLFPTFPFRGWNYVRVRCKIDDTFVGDLYIEKPKGSAQNPREPLTVTFNEILLREGNTLKWCRFTFGRLDLGE